MSTQPVQMTKIAVEGEIFEVWEDPRYPFGHDSDYLDRYARKGQWVLLFNALTLTAEHETVLAERLRGQC